MRCRVDRAARGDRERRCGIERPADIDLAVIDEDMGIAAVEAQMVVELIMEAAGKPETIAVRYARIAIGIDSGRLIIFDAGPQFQRVGQLVFAADSERYGIAIIFRRNQVAAVIVGVNEDLLEIAPAIKVAFGKQRELRCDALLNTERHDIRQIKNGRGADIAVTGRKRPAEAREGDRAVIDIVADAIAIGKTDLRAGHRLQ